MLIRFH